MLRHKLGGGNSNIFDVHTEIGEDSQFLLIFFRWVGSTTNQISWENRHNKTTEKKTTRHIILSNMYIYVYLFFKIHNFCQRTRRQV